MVELADTEPDIQAKSPLRGPVSVIGMSRSEWCQAQQIVIAIQGLIPATLYANLALVLSAFTHKSFSNNYPSRVIESNERLEFLGDAALSLVASDYGIVHYNMSEAGLSQFRALLCSNDNLAKVGWRLGLDKYLRRSGADQHARPSDYQVACTLEALIGAIYAVGGLGEVRQFFCQHILPDYSAMVENQAYNGLDPKSYLQMMAQESVGVTPVYSVVAIKEDWPNKVVTVAVTLGGRELARGSGPNKKKASIQAAENALVAWQGRC